ncbi:MAG: hypothetical protein JNK48_19730 [Bryobacterales bacterium]|nr:hypothetical protein [Bryobacterales bacterium]
MRVLIKAVVATVAAYTLLAGTLFAVMWLPPGQFAAIAARLPGPLLLRVLPFQQAWSIARAGSLAVGDAAPDFDLARHDKSGRVTLREHRGRPVVLIFGSYT